MLVFLETLLWLSMGLLVLFYLSYYGLMVYEGKKPDNVRKRRIFPRVSLVVPTYNEEEVILRKLKNVKSLDYPKEKLEVIVVDSASTDKTRQIVQNFADKNTVKLKLRLITQSKRLGKASALNYARQYCNGEIVIISDVDVTFEERAITKIVQNFADSAVGAVSGRLFIVNSDQSSITQLEESYRRLFRTLRIGESRIDSTPIFNGPIMAFRKGLLDELESDTVTDDIELALKIREKGWRAIYEPEAVAYEFTPAHARSRIKQKSRRGFGIIQSFIRHRRILFNPKYGKYGLIVFPGEFFMHIISPILVAVSIASIIIGLVLRPSFLVPFMLIAVSLFAFFGLSSLIQKLTTNKIIANPVPILATFLDQQMCLLLSLFFFFIGRSSYKWEKIEEVRTAVERTVA